jgi:hypothetical protein
MKARLASLIAVLGMLAGCGGPEAEGYFSGGIAGFSCPPGTEAEGSCSDPDCDVPCVAVTECESNDGCPDGTVCDSSVGYCMPDSCSEAGDCEGGDACDTEQFAKGVCLGGTE